MAAVVSSLPFSVRFRFAVYCAAKIMKQLISRQSQSIFNMKGVRLISQALRYLSQIGGFSNAVDAAEGDDVWSALLLALHGVSQDIHTAFGRQDLDTRILQGLLDSAGDACVFMFQIMIKTSSS
jgi:hypothetical protein